MNFTIITTCKLYSSKNKQINLIQKKKNLPNKQKIAKEICHKHGSGTDNNEIF